MHTNAPVREVIDLTDPSRNVVFNMTVDEARQRVASGDPTAVRGIDGQFALVGRDGNRVRLARSLAVPMRYFMAKRGDGPVLVVAHRIDTIAQWLESAGLADQFYPTYTRMAPAHYLTEIFLVGCPDPNPTFSRFFAPERDTQSTDLQEIGRAYVGATADDSPDGDITSSIVTVNPVNPAVVGQYTVTYDVSDSSDNPAVQVTRTVNVEDNTPPVIALAGANPVTLELLDGYVDRRSSPCWARTRRALKQGRPMSTPGRLR